MPERLEDVGLCADAHASTVYHDQRARTFVVAGDDFPTCLRDAAAEFENLCADLNAGLPDWHHGYSLVPVELRITDHSEHRYAVTLTYDSWSDE